MKPDETAKPRILSREQEINKETVDHLRRILAEAEEGKIQSFLMVKFRPDGKRQTEVSGYFDALRKQGAMLELLHDLLHDSDRPG